MTVKPNRNTIAARKALRREAESTGKTTAQIMQERIAVAEQIACNMTARRQAEAVETN